MIVVIYPRFADSKISAKKIREKEKYFKKVFLLKSFEIGRKKIWRDFNKN
jgi:hypothetical protein